MKLSRAGLALLGLVVAVTTLGCPPATPAHPGGSGATPPAPAGATIKIAVAGPFSGDQKKQGDDVWNAVQLAVEEWNAKGGVLGKKIEMIKRDDEAKPGQAVQAARQIASEGVAGVVGHFNSGCTIPASAVYEKAGLVMLTPSATNPELTDQKLWNVFRVVGRDDAQGSFAASFVMEKLKPKKVAVVHDKTTYGKGLADEFKKGIEKAGGVEITSYTGVNEREVDYKQVLTGIKDGKPDLWYFGGMYSTGGPLTVQAREVGLAAPLMSGDGLKEPDYIKIAGEKAEGNYMTFGPDPNDVPTAKGFLEAYRKKFGEEGPYSINGYDCANILLKAIEKSGSTVGKTLAETIRAATHDGALGKLSFDEKGDLKTSIYIMWQVKGGKFIVVK